MCAVPHARRSFSVCADHIASLPVTSLQAKVTVASRCPWRVQEADRRVRVPSPTGEEAQAIFHHRRRASAAYPFLGDGGGGVGAEAVSWWPGA